MISLSFLNLLGVDIIQLFGVGFQWASSVRLSQTSLLGEAELYSHTPATRRRHPQDVKEEEGGEAEKRSEPRTRLTPALAPYSPLRAAVGDPERSRARGRRGPARRQTPASPRRGASPCPPHPEPATSSTAAGRTRGARRRSAPLLETRSGRSGQGRPRRAGAATLPSCSGRRLRRARVPPGPGCCRRGRRSPVGKGCR